MDYNDKRNTDKDGDQRCDNQTRETGMDVKVTF